MKLTKCSMSIISQLKNIKGHQCKYMQDTHTRTCTHTHPIMLKYHVGPQFADFELELDFLTQPSAFSLRPS